MMYSFAFFGGSSDPRVVRFRRRVLGDMASEGVHVDPAISKSLLLGRSKAMEDVVTAISAFKLIESAYFLSKKNGSNVQKSSRCFSDNSTTTKVRSRWRTRNTVCGLQKSSTRSTFSAT